jgi:hypothetical protein
MYETIGSELSSEEVGRLAVDFIEAHRESPQGVVVSTADACRAVRADPAAARRKIPELRAAAAEHRRATISRNAQATAVAVHAYQDKMAAAGVQVGTLAALDAVRSGRARRAAVTFSESALDLVARDPAEMPRAIVQYQHEMAELGITLSTAAAAVELREYLDRLGVRPLPFAAETLRNAEAVGLTRETLAREVERRRGNWPFKGASRTSAELALVVIKEAAAARAGKPMTAAELARLGGTAAPA